MFKKIFVLTLCALMLLTSAMAEGWTAPAAGDPLGLEGDLGLYLNDTWFPILNDFDGGLHETLGQELDMMAAPSCAFKGDDKEFVYEGMSIYTNPLGDMDVWMEAYITAGDWTTTRGIGIGATKDDVIAAYGDGFYSDTDDMMTYSISGDPTDYASPCIIFTLEDDAVVCIDIYYPTNTL